MPRIDPLQLLRCLSVLLGPDGGIRSGDEVPRLVNLMTKFSKKLVSKCVYILILRNTDQPLVDMFMTEGGWALIQTWLQDSIHISNWDLVKEILLLLLYTPVDVERLKLNNIPKLVKGLSRLQNIKEVQTLSTQLVHNWLIIVKNSASSEESIQRIEPMSEHNLPQYSLVPPSVDDKLQIEGKHTTSQEQHPVNSIVLNESSSRSSNKMVTAFKKEQQQHTVYKMTIKDGKHVISKSITETDAKKAADQEKIASKERSKSSESSSNRSKSSRDRHKSSGKTSSSSTSNGSSSRDDKKERDDRHRHNSSSSKHSKDRRESQADKDKETLSKIRAPTLDKLGRIPKKSDTSKVVDQTTPDRPKSTISIEARKDNGGDESRPKTVKVFNSKRRITGLEEATTTTPPPSRSAKRLQSFPVTAATGTNSTPTFKQQQPVTVKRSPSSNDNIGSSNIPDKKARMEHSSSPLEQSLSSMKRTPPKPKPPVLLESDIFMDALAASASDRKDVRKRKRRSSTSKDVTETSSSSTQPVESPTVSLKSIGKLNFYQDTLKTEDSLTPPPSADAANSSCEDIIENDDFENSGVATAAPEDETTLRGVLVVHGSRRKGAKKSVRFNDADLTQVRLFELDETERVNVTKTFIDMAKMEMTNEREALQMSRKLPSEDLMEPQTFWRPPQMILVEQPAPLAEPGCKSLEKDIQFAREKSVSIVIYFDKRKIPESPEEPLPENHQVTTPIPIPLEDAESQETDLRNTPWPEPKTNSPPPMACTANNNTTEAPNTNHTINNSNNTNSAGQMYSTSGVPMQYPPNFAANIPPPGVVYPMPPRFNAPYPPHMMMNGMAPPPPPQGPGGPPFMGPVDGGGNFGGPMPPHHHPQFNPIFGGPNNFNSGPRPPPPPRPSGFRPRGGGNHSAGPWVTMSRGSGGGNWNRGGGNQGGRGGRFCKNVKLHGFCRNRDNCPFVHP